MKTPIMKQTVLSLAIAASLVPIALFATELEAPFTGSGTYDDDVTITSTAGEDAIAAVARTVELHGSKGHSLTVNISGEAATGIMATGSTTAGIVIVRGFDKISIIATGDDADGLWVTSNASVSLNAEKEVEIDMTGTTQTDQWNAGMFVEDGASASITAPKISISAVSSGENDPTAAIYAISSATVTLTGDGTDTLTISATKGSDYNFGIASEMSSVTATEFTDVEITSDDIALIALPDAYYKTATSGTAAINFSDVGTITLNGKEGIFSAADQDINTTVSLKANDKISIQLSSADESLFHGTAVTSVFTLGGASVGGTSTVSLEADTIEVTGAKNAFVAVVDYETESTTIASTSDPKSIINVTANELNVTATDFIALAYSDYSVIDGDFDSQAPAQVNINVKDGSPNGKSTLSGNVFASHGSIVNIGLGEGSTWTGFSEDSRSNEITHTSADGATVDTRAAGEVNVYAGDGAVWYVQPVAATEITENSSESPYGYGEATATISFGASNSSITSWNSSGKSKVDLRLFDASSGSGSYQTLNIGSLTGSDAIFLLNTDIDAERGSGQTDQVIIDSGSGSHYIAVSTSGEGSAEEQADYLVVVGDSGASFNLADENGNATTTVEEGLYKYELASRDAKDGSGTEWYLLRSDDSGESGGGGEGGGGGGKTPTSNEGIVVTALAGAGARLAMHYAWLDDLRKRLGEVRYGAQDGLWARFIYQRDSAHGTSSYGFRQNWYGVNFGLDHLLSQDESNKWLLGGNLKSAHASQKVKSVSSGKGNLNSYGMNLYATYLNQYGCYADLVFSLDKYHQKVSARTDSGSSVFGKFNTWGWGLSAEVGKMFSFKLNNDDGGVWDNHWWVEPQIQLSYYWTEGKNWAMNNGMTVDQKNGQSLVGRAGVVIGKQWKYGSSADKSDKRYAQVYVKGGVKHEFLGKQDATVNSVLFDNRLRGTSGYYGVGVDWNLAKKVRAYAQVERDAGGKYRKDIDVSLGLKWQF